MCQHKDFSSEKSSDSINSNVYFGNQVCFSVCNFRYFVTSIHIISFYSLKGVLGESFYCTCPDFQSNFCFPIICRTLPAQWFKGTVSQGFCYRFFSWIRPLITTHGSFQIFSKILGDICKSRCNTSINDTCGKFATGINNTAGKFCHQFRYYCWYQWKICQRCQWYRRQTMGTISDW